MLWPRASITINKNQYDHKIERREMCIRDSTGVVKSSVSPMPRCPLPSISNGMVMVPLWLEAALSFSVSFNLHSFPCRITSVTFWREPAASWTMLTPSGKVKMICVFS